MTPELFQIKDGMGCHGVEGIEIENCLRPFDRGYKLIVVPVCLSERTISIFIHVDIFSYIFPYSMFQTLHWALEDIKG